MPIALASSAREGINVLMISQSSSEQNICFVVQQAANGRALQALEKEFELERTRRNYIHQEFELGG